MHSLTATSSAGESVSGHSGGQDGTGTTIGLDSTRASAGTTMALRDVEKSGSEITETEIKWKRTWYGKKIRIASVDDGPEKRPAKLFAAIYNGLAAGLVFSKSGLHQIHSGDEAHSAKFSSVTV